MRTSIFMLGVMALAWVTSCGSESAPSPEGSSSASAAATAALDGDVLVEEHAGGSITWKIAGDGEVKALVEVANKPVTHDVSGTLVFKAKEDKTVPLAADAKTGVLVAAGPKLEADLTEVAYTLSVEGKPWSGHLHLPRGGTAELVANAKAAARFDGKLGPHGGMIQVVGPDIFEIVQIEGTGEIRVYLLSPELELELIGDRKITLAVSAEAEAPKLVVLVPEPELGLYASAKARFKAEPVRITLAVRHGAKISVALVGFRPGVRIKVGVKAPRLKIKVKAKAVADFDANLKAKFDAKADADINVKAKVKAPKAKVQKKASASAGGGKAKASAGVKIGF